MVCEASLSEFRNLLGDVLVCIPSLLVAIELVAHLTHEPH